MSIDEVAGELYGLPPEEFTAARNARAKEAASAGDGDLAARVKGLRKPTAGAWLLNQLVRHQADEVRRVIDLGAQLRSAQGAMSAQQLRELNAQRRELTRAVARQAGRIGEEAGRRVTPAVLATVEESLRSAMVDEAAGAALTSGLLTDTFSSNGLEPVDLSQVVALYEPGSAATAQMASEASGTEDELAGRRTARELADAQRALEEADAVARRSRDAAGSARARVEAASTERERLEAELEEVRGRLERLQEQVERAAAAQAAAQEESAGAEATEAGAEEQLSAVRARVEELLEGV